MARRIGCQFKHPIKRLLPVVDISCGQIGKGTIVDVARFVGDTRSKDLHRLAGVFQIRQITSNQRRGRTINVIGELLNQRVRVGVDILREHLKQLVAFEGAQEGDFSARRRHLDAIQRASGHLLTGRRSLSVGRAGELLAEDLRQAQLALSEITGEFSSDDLLGEIFGSFCIGK